MFHLVFAYAIAGIVSLIGAHFAASRMAGAGFPLPDEGRRIGYIDGLRGYLALLVAISHFVIWVRLIGFDIPWGDAPYVIRSIGQGPVAIFFMITGLLFYPKVRNGFGQVAWGSLLVSRVFRIYPAALLAISLITIGLWISSGLTTDIVIIAKTAGNLVQWIFFTGEPPLFGIEGSHLANAGVFWTLNAEWIFYIAVLPLFAILRSIASDKLPRTLSPLLMAPLYPVFKTIFPGFAFITHFMLGMVIFEITQNERISAVFRKNSVAIGALLVMVCAVLWLPTPTTGRTVIFYAPFLACVACGHSYFGVLATRGSLVLGEVSYGIYVLHGFVLWSIVQFGRPLVAAHPLASAVAMPPLMILISVVAALTFLLIEAPMIRKGHTLARRLRRQKASLASGAI